MHAQERLHFDEVEVGQEWESAARSVSELDIVSFADLTGDRQPIHMDEEYARRTPFQRRIAHGLLGISLGCGLALDAPPMKTQAFLALCEWHFRAPVFIGDSIRVFSKVLSKELSGRGRRGTISWRITIVNQHGQVVQEGVTRTLVECLVSAMKDRSKEAAAHPASAAA